MYAEPGGKAMQRGWRGRRSARVLTSVVLGLGWVGSGWIGELPAGARPSGVSDDVPQPPEEIVPFVAELIDFGLLRDTLREEYPNTFAGLVNNGNGSITIYETRASNALHQWVTQRFQDAAEANDVDPALIPTVTYRTAGRSLSALFSLKNTVMAATASMTPRNP